MPTPTPPVELTGAFKTWSKVMTLTTELLKLSEALICSIALAVISFPKIVSKLSGVVVPIPTLSPILAKITFVEVLFQEVELDKLPEPPASVPQLSTPFASVSTVLQFARFGNETLPETFKVPEMFTFPITTSFSDGDVVPMPTLPEILFVFYML